MKSPLLRHRNRLVTALLAVAICALVHVPAWTQSPDTPDEHTPSSPLVDHVAAQAFDWMADHPPSNDQSSPIFALAIAARHGSAPPLRITNHDVADILAASPELSPFLSLAGLQAPLESPNDLPSSPWAQAMLAALRCTHTAASDQIVFDLRSQDPWIVTHTATALQWMFEQGCVLPADWQTLQSAMAQELRRISVALDVTTTLGTEILAVALYTRSPLDGLSDHIDALRRDAGRDGSFHAPDDDTWHRTMLAWWALLEWHHGTNPELPAMTQLVPRTHADVATTPSFQGVVFTNAAARPVPQPLPIAYKRPHIDTDVEASGAGAPPTHYPVASGEPHSALLHGLTAQPTAASHPASIIAPLPLQSPSSDVPAQIVPIQPHTPQPSNPSESAGCLGG